MLPLESHESLPSQGLQSWGSFLMDLGLQDHDVVTAMLKSPEVVASRCKMQQLGLPKRTKVTERGFGDVGMVLDQGFSGL